MHKQYTEIISAQGKSIFVFSFLSLTGNQHKNFSVIAGQGIGKGKQRPINSAISSQEAHPKK